MTASPQNPQPPTLPKKVVSSFRGIEASKSKNPLGDCFVGQNNDFTKGWTSNIMPCYANDPNGGCMVSAPALDLTTSLRGDFDPPPNSPKSGTRVREGGGVEESKSKKFIGGFRSQNDDFTTG